MTRTQHVALKGIRDGLVLYLDPDIEFSILVEELISHLTDSAQFLQGAAVQAYAAERVFSEAELEKLVSVLNEYGLNFKGWLKKEQIYREKTQSSGKENSSQMIEEGMLEGNCLFIERTLRSGKSIQYDGHVVVLGDVNPGAEIVATGNIVVLGALRGVAHAGATGDRNALVNAYYLDPTQLRIADLVTRAPKDEEGWHGPEVARIKGDQLIVEGLALNNPKGKLF